MCSNHLRMRRIIHIEGRRIIVTTTLIALLCSVAAVRFLPLWLSAVLCGLLLLKILFVCRFFRVPFRPFDTQADPLKVYSPADGTVVAIEEVYEDEILGEKRIQVSIFMSIWNIHINWFPVAGTVEYHRHHSGRFLVAWHPKSSTDNERTTTVINTGTHRILFRQIAGFVARRIVSYAQEQDCVQARTECGFIKFGSRVDLFLPLDAKINVKLDDKVVGTKTVIAEL